MAFANAPEWNGTKRNGTLFSYILSPTGTLFDKDNYARLFYLPSGMQTKRGKYRMKYVGMKYVWFCATTTVINAKVGGGNGGTKRGKKRHHEKHIKLRVHGLTCLSLSLCVSLPLHQQSASRSRINLQTQRCQLKGRCSSRTRATRDHCFFADNLFVRRQSDSCWLAIFQLNCT